MKKSASRLFEVYGNRDIKNSPIEGELRRD